MIILGIDPGSRRTGYGAIETDGRGHHSLLAQGVISPSSRVTLAQKLACVHAGVVELIARLQPEAIAVEDCFHSANTRTALVLGHVRGVILLAGAQAGLTVLEFPPATVKVQVTGFGRAEKTQVALMVTRLLRLSDPASAGDATDALAVALCGAHLGRPLTPTGVPSH